MTQTVSHSLICSAVKSVINWKIYASNTRMSNQNGRFVPHVWSINQNIFISIDSLWFLFDFKIVLLTAVPVYTQIFWLINASFQNGATHWCAICNFCFSVCFYFFSITNSIHFQTARLQILTPIYSNQSFNI